MSECETEFKELELKILKDIAECPCEIFLRTTKGKMFKIGDKGSLLDPKVCDKYSGREDVKVVVSLVDYPYVLKARLIGKMSKMKEQLNDKQWVNRLQRFDKELNSIAMVRAMVSSFGMNEVTLELVEKTMDSTIYSIEKIPSLKTILGDICGRGDFFFQKALMINYLSMYALSKTAWDNDSTRNKLSMAAFLHDFKASDEKFIKNPPNEDASVDERRNFDKFKNHPAQEAIELSKVKDIPDDVLKIVKLHHVDLDGTGYPINEVSNLNPLSQIFNIAHNVSVTLIKEGYSKKAYSGYFYDLSPRILERYKESLDPYSYLL